MLPTAFLRLAIACGFTTRAVANSTTIGMACVGVDGHLLPLFGTSSHIGSELARWRWVGGNSCASQPSPSWCFLMAMTAVAALEGSLERVLGQRKACSCSRMCCSHYTAPLGTPVTPGDTTGHAVSWSQVSIRPPLIIKMVSVLPLVLDLSTQPLGSQGEVIGVNRSK